MRQANFLGALLPSLLSLSVALGTAETALADDGSAPVAAPTGEAQPRETVASLPESAPPTDAIPYAKVERKHHRIAGFGTMFGVGFGIPDSFYGLAIALPTFEAQIFLPHDFSIDLSNSLSGTIFAAINDSVYVNHDLYVNFNLGHGNVRCVIGPGAGFTYSKISGEVANASLRIPAQLGAEFLTNNEKFGFKLITRPWIETALNDHGALGGGVMTMLGFSGFVIQ